MEKTKIWSHIQATQAVVVQQLAPKVQEAVQESIFNGVDRWFHVGLAYEIYPEPMTVKRTQVRNPYTKPEALADNIANLKSHNLLNAEGIITERAFNAYQGLVDVQEQVARDITPEDTEALDTVNAYLKQIHDAALTMDAPCLADSSKRDLHENPVHRLYDLISSLAAFRDDAHLQAWKPLQMNGQIYEAFSLIWDGTAKDAGSLFEARSGRGYEESDWQAALEQLIEKDWLVKEGDTYAVSDEGKRIRDEIETKTDEFFYAAFDNLNAENLKELINLLQDVQATFTPEPQNT